MASLCRVELAFRCCMHGSKLFESVPRYAIRRLSHSLSNKGKANYRCRNVVIVVTEVDHHDVSVVRTAPKYLVDFGHPSLGLILEAWDKISKFWPMEYLMHASQCLYMQRSNWMTSFSQLIVLFTVLSMSLFTGASFGTSAENFELHIPELDQGPFIEFASYKDSTQTETFLDFAQVVNHSKAETLLKDIQALENEMGWKLRVVTKSDGFPSLSGKELKELWKPDEKTVIVIEDISSPNILNFNAGTSVLAKLPRQFFLELQSRYGNQFFVQEEGEGVALISTVQTIEKCLRKAEGCKNVPGLTNDLYYLTLATSIASGCVFGFALRLPPQGRVEASWQWVVYLSPLWLLLFVSFGILPVTGRTAELTPLIKNALGFVAAAAAMYLTPIFGPSPISKK